MFVIIRKSKESGENLEELASQGAKFVFFLYYFCPAFQFFSHFKSIKK